MFVSPENKAIESARSDWLAGTEDVVCPRPDPIFNRVSLRKSTDSLRISSDSQCRFLFLRMDIYSVYLYALFISLSLSLSLSLGVQKERQAQRERERERERERQVVGSTYERANDKTRITCNWSPC